jgi:GNAT superfamily N-acetyltransferase
LTNVRKLVRLLLGTGNIDFVLGLIRRWLWSDAVAVGLRRELTTPIPARRPTVRLEVRPIRPAEWHAFTDLRGDSVRGEQGLIRVNAYHLLRSGIRTCYVAVTEDGEPCYMQFLILPDENDRLDKVFGGLFPPLEPEEALVEFAFTLEPYRARGVMPFALAELAEEARRKRVRWLVTYVPAHQVTLLRFFERSGFRRFRLRRERYRLFRRGIRFEPT